MNILAWIVVGLLCGWLARQVGSMPEPGGLPALLLIGVIGAFVGGWLFQAFGNAALVDAINLHGVLTATLGAVVFLFIWKALAAGRTY